MFNSSEFKLYLWVTRLSESLYTRSICWPLPSLNRCINSKTADGRTSYISVLSSQHGRYNPMASASTKCWITSGFFFLLSQCTHFNGNDKVECSISNVWNSTITSCTSLRIDCWLMLGNQISFSVDWMTYAVCSITCSITSGIVKYMPHLLQPFS